MTTIQPPTLIDGRYSLDQPLGRGPGSLVMRGTDTVLARPIAIKLVNADQTLAYRAAMAETARLGHPAFVGIFDSLEHGDQLAIIQEFIDGETFADLAAEALAPRAVAQIGQEIALALTHAHRLGIVHGDLTPATIMRDQWGAVRINDVALPPSSAYFAAAAPILDAGSWTPYAPEFRDDLRAMGVLLWLLVARLAEPPATSAGWEACPAEVPAPLRDLIERLIVAQHPAAITSAEDAVNACRLVIRQLAPAPTSLAKIPPWELPRSTIDIAPSRPRRAPAPAPPPVERVTHAPSAEPEPFTPSVAAGPLPPRATDEEPTWSQSRLTGQPERVRTPSSQRRTLDLIIWAALLIALYLFWLVVGYFVPGLFGK